MTELEQYVFAFYLDSEAAQFTMDPRFCSSRELVGIIENRIRFSVAAFDVSERSVWEHTAREMFDRLIERSAFSTSEDEYGAMHKFQRDQYRTCIAGLQAANPIIAQARAAGPAFWQDAFARLLQD